MADSCFLDRRSLVETWPGAIIAASSIVCFAVLLFCRLKILLEIGYHPYWKLPARAIVLSYEDFIALAILSFASLLLCFLSPRLVRCIASTHCILIILFASVGFINSIVQPLYSTPISMSLLEYSGALDFGSINTLAGYLSDGDLVFVSIIFALGLPAVYFSALIVRKIKAYPPRINGFFFVSATVYVSFCAVVVPTRTTPAQQRTENAAVYFAESIFERLPHIRTNLGNLVFDPYESELNTDQVLRNPGVKLGGHSPIRNVAIFVLESVGAQYLDIYGGMPGTTPHLRGLLKHSLVFNNGYATVPKTPASMFSILTSVYPAVAYNTFPEKNPRIALPTLTMMLKQKGYRTGIFLSADARYGKVDEFLQGRGIDKVEDYRGRYCTDPLLLKGSLQAGTTDRCTAASMEKWIEQSPERPFFALMWTNETHYPYSTRLERYVYGGITPLSADLLQETKARYPRAIREADAVLQDFVDFLDRRNLLRSTLIVVVGDHGEGFGQHGVYVHGTEIYDEFVRIPFLLINPVLFDGKVSHRNAALIDLAPTILGLLGERSPSSWQGFDLLGSRSRRYNYSFVTWGNFKISLRTRERSYIYDVARDRVQVFDRTVDPLEMQDIGDTVAPDEIGNVKLEIGVWKDRQDQYLNQRNSDVLVSNAINK